MKHIFTLEIPEAKDGRDAYRQLQKIGVENRLGEFVTQVARVTESDWKAALNGKAKKK
jgi:hypothetical protein